LMGIKITQEFIGKSLLKYFKNEFWLNKLKIFFRNLGFIFLKNKEGRVLYVGKTKKI
jgi:hypothetical protein